MNRVGRCGGVPLGGAGVAGVSLASTSSMNKVNEKISHESRLPATHYHEISGRVDWADWAMPAPPQLFTSQRIPSHFPWFQVETFRKHFGWRQLILVSIWQQRTLASFLPPPSLPPYTHPPVPTPVRRNWLMRNKPRNRGRWSKVQYICDAPSFPLFFFFFFFFSLPFWFIFLVVIGFSFSRPVLRTRQIWAFHWFGL